MKILKYAGITLAESIITMIVFFLMPTVTKGFDGNTTVWVYIAFAVVILLEYLYLWFLKRGGFFTVPLSLLFILIIVLFYFNSPDNVKAVWAVRAIGKNFIMPTFIVSLITSGILWGFNRIRLR